MNGKSAQSRPGSLDLSDVNTRAQAEADCLGVPLDRLGAADRPDRSLEHGQQLIANQLWIATVKHLEPHRGKNAVGDDTVPRTREELLDLADECLDIPQPHCVIAALQLDEPGARDALGEVTTGRPRSDGVVAAA